MFEGTKSGLFANSGGKCQVTVTFVVFVAAPWGFSSISKPQNFMINRLMWAKVSDREAAAEDDDAGKGGGGGPGGVDELLSAFGAS